MPWSRQLITQSERLALRVYEPPDSAALFEITGSPETMRLMPRGLLADEAAAKEWIDRRRAMQQTDGYSIWAVLLRCSDQLIGNCGFSGERDGSLEVGYVLDYRHWGSGYATEAAAATVAYGFDSLDASSVVATIRPGNEPSIAVAHRLGMQQIESTADQHGELLLFRLERNEGRESPSTSSKFPNEGTR